MPATKTKEQRLAEFAESMLLKNPNVTDANRAELRAEYIKIGEELLQAEKN